ncbi:MAG: cation diffusion facilitator family transporter [Bacteriovoracaceae bacterium]|nr:cation diffusion facilitator family transporter [Bacteriovoracaceae bacterium]
MGNHHGHNHHHGSKNILVAFFLNFTFAIIELIGGYYTNSVAIISDAIHDFGDSLALLFSYFAEKLSQKEANENYTFGYRRFSILSAFINGLILFLGSLYVIYEATGRILNPEAVKPEGMIFLAILGICVNSFAAYRLSKDEGLNSKMVMYHLFEDLLGWVAVLIVSIILLFKPWYQLDSILSILISLVILRGVYKNLKKVGAIFLQKFPDDLKLASLKDEVSELDLVQDIHAIKGLSIDDTSYYLSFHIKVPSDTMIKEVDLLRAKMKLILKKYGVEDSTIEFESICE